MEYVKLDDEWKEKVRDLPLSNTGFDLVKVIDEDGITYSAELVNAKKLRMMNAVKVEKIQDIKML